MDQDSLDKFIKEQLEAYETPSDADLFWENLALKDVEEEKPKRITFIGWITGASILLILAASYCYLQNYAEGSDNAKIKEEYIAIKKVYDENNSIYKEEPLTIEKASSGESIKNIEEGKNSGGNALDIKKSKSKKQKEFLHPKIDYDNKVTSRHNIVNAKIPFTSNGKEPNAQSYSSGKIYHSSQSLTEALTFSSPKEDQNTTNGLLKSKEGTMLHSKLPPLATKLNGVLSINIKDPFRNILINDLRYVANHNGKINNKNWKVSTLSMDFAYGLANRKLETQTRAIDQAYLTTREEKEQSLDVLRFGFNATIENKNGCYFKVGLNYDQIAEEFVDNIFWKVDTTFSDLVLSEYYHADGTVTEELGSLSLPVPHYSLRSTINRYRFIDLPLLFGYNFNNKRSQFSWFAELGVSINLFFKPSGEILDSNYKIIKLEDDLGLFKDRTGWSLHGAAGCRYQIRDRIGLWAGPALKFNLNEINTQTNAISQKYRSYTFQLGLYVNL